VRSERMLMEQMRYNLLFRWFVGLAIEDAVWDHSVRLAELAWPEADGLPRVDVDPQAQWTLHVLGKGSKRRSIPLPSVCACRIAPSWILAALPVSST
jgi:site-specific recombinase XerC